MNTTLSLKIIDEICKENDIEERLLSFGWIRELKKGDKTCHIVRNAFDLNPASSYDIMNDKYATYEVLKANGVEVLEHTMLFNPASRKDFAEDIQTKINEAYQKYNRKNCY